MGLISLMRLFMSPLFSLPSILTSPIYLLCTPKMKKKKKQYIGDDEIYNVRNGSWNVNQNARIEIFHQRNIQQSVD